LEAAETQWSDSANRHNHRQVQEFCIRVCYVSDMSNTFKESEGTVKTVNPVKNGKVSFTIIDTHGVEVPCVSGAEVKVDSPNEGDVVVVSAGKMLPIDNNEDTKEFYFEHLRILSTKRC